MHADSLASRITTESLDYIPLKALGIKAAAQVTGVISNITSASLAEQGSPGMYQNLSVNRPRVV